MVHKEPVSFSREKRQLAEQTGLTTTKLATGSRTDDKETALQKQKRK